MTTQIPIRETQAELRASILSLTQEYCDEKYSPKDFIPGITPIRPSGCVLDGSDISALVDCALKGWLTAGPIAAEFEKQFTKFVGCRSTTLVNSGSSANLLALTALTSPKLGSDALKPGDEVITVAAGFPTTLNPIIQNGLVPVFVDVTLTTYQIDVNQLEAARSDKTRAVMIAHTLGNPFDVNAVRHFCQRNDLYLIEDCCDALGTTIGEIENCGTFGHVSTCSFYPAHHITMGEGGAVMTNVPGLKKIVESLRDWGRDCWCAGGKDNTCGTRFDCQMGQLPYGFDHKYTYSHIGYNLKATEMQAAVGLSQLQRLPEFIEARKRNFTRLKESLLGLEDFILLPEPTQNSDPSWFGFPITVWPKAFKRDELTAYLESKNVGTRMIFAGNLLRQPAYQGIKHRKIGELPNSDYIMRNSFWIGVQPALTDGMIDFMGATIREFCEDKR